VTSMAATLVRYSFEKQGQTVWMDKKDLAADSQGLKDAIEQELLGMKMAVLCMGPGDLERCLDKKDFFRWEIDRARKLEVEGRLRVVIIVHGTVTFEDLICGFKSDKQRNSLLKQVGKWGEDLLNYLRSHFVVFFDKDKLDEELKKIATKL